MVDSPCDQAGEKILLLWDSTAISLPSRSSLPEVCWVPSSSNLPPEKVFQSICRRLFRRSKKSLVAEVSHSVTWLIS